MFAHGSPVLTARIDNFSVDVVVTAHVPALPISFLVALPFLFVAAFRLR